MSARVDINSDRLVVAKPSSELLERRLRRGIYKQEPDGLYRRCSRCRDYWPADSEFFFTDKNDADGLGCWCKACYMEWRWPNGRPSQTQALEVAA